MSNIQIFNFQDNNQFPVKILIQDNKEYFLAKNVCDILELANVSQALSRLEKDDICSGDVIDSLGRTQKMSFVNEAGLLKLIFKSNKASSELKDNFISFLQDNHLITRQNIIYSRQEIEFLETLQKILQPFDYECVRQYQILNYRVDLYIKDLNVVIEYDEESIHNWNIRKAEDLKRQLQIEEKIGCKFIRVSNKDSHLWNCGFIMKQIFK